ncbi:hypothetical protein TNCV_898601 [Trichonephila clavipes]|nr:hypothetical protein TNCV_898601 [Trichonephila clavipes]
MVAKILVFGSKSTKFLSSLIGDPGRAKKNNNNNRSSHGAIYPPQMQPSRQTHETTNKAFTQDEITNKPSHTNDANASVALKTTQLLTCLPYVWYRSFTYSPNHWQGSSVVVVSI